MKELIFNDDATKWYSKKEICGICKVDEKTFRRFKKETNLETTAQVKKNLNQGDKNVDYYTKKYHSWYDNYENY